MLAQVTEVCLDATPRYAHAVRAAALPQNGSPKLFIIARLPGSAAESVSEP